MKQHYTGNIRLLQGRMRDLSGDMRVFLEILLQRRREGGVCPAEPPASPTEWRLPGSGPQVMMAAVCHQRRPRVLEGCYRR